MQRSAGNELRMMHPMPLPAHADAELAREADFTLSLAPYAGREMPIVRCYEGISSQKCRRNFFSQTMLGRPSMQDVRKGFQDVNHAADAEVFFQFFDASTAAKYEHSPTWRDNGDHPIFTSRTSNVMEPKSEWFKCRETSTLSRGASKCRHFLRRSRSPAV
jgi:hypothetical protein